MRLTIMDYAIGEVHSYVVDGHIECPETLVEQLGYNLDDCHYMYHYGEISINGEIITKK